MPASSETSQAVARQYTRYLEADAAARQAWDKAHRELRKLAKLAELGRRATVTVPISESRGLRITNQFRTREDKIFTPAFCRRFELKELPLCR